MNRNSYNDASRPVLRTVLRAARQLLPLRWYTWTFRLHQRCKYRPVQDVSGTKQRFDAQAVSVLLHPHLGGRRWRGLLSRRQNTSGRSDPFWQDRPSTAEIPGITGGYLGGQRGGQASAFSRETHRDRMSRSRAPTFGEAGRRGRRQKGVRVGQEWGLYDERCERRRQQGMNGRL